MVNSGHRYPGTGYMTRFANVRGVDVTRRQTMTTCTRAGTEHFGMINRDHRYPGGAVMTGFTNVGGVNVRRTLTDGGDTIVTTDAGTIDLCMVYRRHGYP